MKIVKVKCNPSVVQTSEYYDSDQQCRTLAEIAYRYPAIILLFFSFSAPVWNVPLVVFCVLALVLVVSTMIAVSCLKRETKKFHKKQGKIREDVVMEIHGLGRS